MWPFENKRKTVAFGDILTGLQNAISMVQGMLQNRQLENLSHFWQPNGQPVCQSVNLGERTIEVPLLTLVPHSQLAMDTVEIKFSTRVNSIVSGQMNDLGTMEKLMDSHISHADFRVAVDGIKTDGDDIMEVSITFKVKDTPEAISRLVDDYNTRI